MTSLEKVAYIRGLMEGLELDSEKKEVKVINAIVELLEDMALNVQDIEDDVVTLEEVIDEIDEDLGDLEETVYGDDEDIDFDEYDEEYDEDEEELFYEVTCPTCGETICFPEFVADDGAIDCPNCGEALEFDLDEAIDVEAEEVKNQ